MSFEDADLKSKFAELLRWERRKRREQNCLMVTCCAFGAAFLLFPLHIYFTPPWLRWLVPLWLCALLAPLWFIRRRWRPLDTTRTIMGLDKALRLDERAITAWEVLPHDRLSSTARWLLHETAARLRGMAPRTLFPRRGSWPGYIAFPLFILWFALLWFNIDHKLFSAGKAAPVTLAHSLRQFARDFSEKAQGEGLRESLKLGHELEKIAAKNLAARSDEQQLKKDLSGMAKKLDAMGKSKTDQQNFAGAESQQSLRDLKAELEAARDLLSSPNSDKADADLAQSSLDRLAALPQLHRQFEKETARGRTFGQSQLKEFLGNLDRQVTNELDRRAVLDAQKFIEQMMQGGERDQGEANAHARDRESGEEPESGEKGRTESNRPGNEPGQKVEGSAMLPPFRGGAETQVKGQIGAGDSSSIVFRGKPTLGKSEISGEHVVASYRRQAEQELNSERVPDALKETIKNYFLSLGEGK